MKPRIGITIGDINGIGPEIILKALIEIDRTSSTPVVVAPPSVIEYYSDHLSLPAEVEILPSKDLVESEIRPGTISSISGRAAMTSIELAVDRCLNGSLHAMVTAPISKEAVHLAGYNIPGHTEFLAEKTSAESVVMMLINDNLRVALTTVHIPISKVATSITPELLKQKIRTLSCSLIQDFKIETPDIAVLGLNPHAGDGGVIGTEEKEILGPVIQEMKAEYPGLQGPYPADAFFGQKLHQQFDAVLAMYHDQGLAPFKLLSFGRGVNFSAGLPIIRTSPDHGTAFNIAGKGIADPSSFLQAYRLAVKLAVKRLSS